MAGQAGHAFRGAAWLLGGQALVVFVQFFYAAFTSHLVPPAVFGAYAVAMATAPLVLLLATAGIGTAAARAAQLTEPQTRALATVSLFLGLAAAGSVWLLAVPWSSLWGNPDAVAATRWSAVGVFPAPFLGLLMGLSRRSGKFRQLSLAASGGGIIGMFIGAICVWYLRSAASLVAMSIAMTTIQSGVLLKVVGRSAWPGRLRRDVVEHLHFGAKVVMANGVGYLTGAAPPLGLSRGLGAVVLGSWNRAGVITQVPLEMIQSSMVQAIYPEFRHDIGKTERASRLWLDLLSLTAWVMLPLAAVVSAFAHFAVPVIFGPGWEAAASFAPWLAMATAANVPVVILGSALEATGRFGGVWRPRAAALGVVALAAGLTFISGDVAPVIAGTLLAPLVGHALQLRYVHRWGIFPVTAILQTYPRILLATAGAGIVTTLGLSATSAAGSLAVTIPLTIGMVLLAGTVLWRARLHLPPVQIAQRYGLFEERR